MIRILNTGKLKQLYKGITFALGKLDTVSMKDGVFNLTGYPCYFANEPAGYDTLINKSIPAAKLLSNIVHIGYRIFTCVGDSRSLVDQPERSLYYRRYPSWREGEGELFRRLQHVGQIR